MITQLVEMLKGLAEFILQLGLTELSNDILIYHARLQDANRKGDFTQIPSLTVNRYNYAVYQFMVHNVIYPYAVGVVTNRRLNVATIKIDNKTTVTLEGVCLPGSNKQVWTITAWANKNISKINQFNVAQLGGTIEREQELQQEVKIRCKHARRIVVYEEYTKDLCKAFNYTYSRNNVLECLTNFYTQILVPQQAKLLWEYAIRFSTIGINARTKTIKEIINE